MHEENIQYIEEYLKENHQFPLDQLLATLRESGYHEDDIVAAQERMKNEAIAPVSSPTGVEALGTERFDGMAPVSHPETGVTASVTTPLVSGKTSRAPHSFAFFAWWLIGIVVILGGVGGGILYWMVPREAAQERVVDPQSLVSEETLAPENTSEDTMASPSDLPEAGDIFETHVRTLHQGDYRVTILHQKSDTPQSGETEHLYLQKGAVVRMEVLIEPVQTIILKNGKAFVLSPAKKEFHEYVVTTPEGQGEVDRAERAMETLQSLQTKSLQGDIRWYQQTDGTYTDHVTEEASTIRVALDPVTSLVREIGVRLVPTDLVWQTQSFTWEPVTNIEELLRFPLDYRKITSESLLR